MGKRGSSAQTVVPCFSVGPPVRPDLFSWKKEEIPAHSLKPELHAQLYVTLIRCKCLEVAHDPALKQGAAGTDSSKKKCGNLSQKPRWKARWT